MLVRMGVSIKNVINTGFEVLEGKGLPVRIVDGTSGEEALEVMPLGCSLNLVRRTARGSFGYTRQVQVWMVPPRAPGQQRADTTDSKRHLGAVDERVAIKRLAEWEDLWKEWSDKTGERRAAEVEWRVLRASGVARNERRARAERLAALGDLEELVCLRANLHGVDVGMLRALDAVIDGGKRRRPTALAAAAARVVWRLAGHPDRRVTALLWDQNVVRSLALAANGATVPLPVVGPDAAPGGEHGIDDDDDDDGDDGFASADWFAHAAALAVLLEAPHARLVHDKLNFDPMPALLRLVDAALDEAAALEAQGGGAPPISGDAKGPKGDLGAAAAAQNERLRSLATMRRTSAVAAAAAAAWLRSV